MVCRQKLFEVIQDLLQHNSEVSRTGQRRSSNDLRMNKRGKIEG